ncbi:MAG: hypothetical protein IT377_28075 [Polyangiaceae bacterium]|nr:hypothetical protein [Myxococcales bacterium]MCC6902861.1 hypothetical protein [Polyangiaceae bacterium]
MASVYLSGILTAWCVTQLALGVFFALAHLVARRERDLLIYGTMCLALAYHSASSARAHVALSVGQRLEAVTGVMEAALLAAALNLHFVSRFVGRKVERRWLVALYGVALLFEAGVALGHWWEMDTAVLSEANVFGVRLINWRAEPTLLARVGFAWVGIQLLLAQLGLFQAARSGQREAYFALGGGLILVGAAANDMLLASGRVQDTLYVAPHAFMLYTFSVASTLVFRYRRTIAELERTERELRSATEELSASHEELREVQTELTKKEQLAAVGELAAAIAHEVRNPLAIIGNAVAGLRRPAVTDPDRGVLLDIVTEEADRLNHLVTDLLRFARPTSLKRSRIDLIELIEHTQAPLGEHHVLNVRGDERARFVDADPNLLRAALDNVIQNAAQAMPGGGTIAVDLSADEGEPKGVLVRLEDSGAGMDPATLARALDPFFTTRPSGTGLGLPIVQRVVQAHGGRVELESRDGAGTTVHIWLPRSEA